MKNRADKWLTPEKIDTVISIVDRKGPEANLRVIIEQVFAEEIRKNQSFSTIKAYICFLGLSSCSTSSI